MFKALISVYALSIGATNGLNIDSCFKVDAVPYYKTSNPKKKSHKAHATRNNKRRSKWKR